MAGRTTEASYVLRPGRATDGADSAVYSRTFADTTSVTYTVPDQWKGMIVRFVSTGAECQVAFGKSDIGALTKDQVSTLATKALTAVDGTGYPIPTNGFADFIIHPDDTDFEVVGAGAGQWFAYATGPAGGAA